MNQVLNIENSVGESPVWSVREQCLYWVDVGLKTVHRYMPLNSYGHTEHSSKQLSFAFSAIFEGQDHRLYLVTEHDIVQFDFHSGRTQAIFECQALDEQHRFNDAKVDGVGRLWLGSMNKTLSEASGNLYCLDPFLQMHNKDQGFAVSNGLAWSPEQDKLYLVETVSRTIYQYDFDLSSGALSNKQVFTTFVESEGKPDGMTVDEQGHVWVAMWDGWAIKQFNPAGKLVESLKVPVARPTSVTFGGKDLDTLFITTANYGISPENKKQYPYSGSLLSYQTNTHGLTSSLFGHK
ncbi:SMP-30/gluconolactonase/LRE family protein [Paraglaciecola sp.]|uniref:SMP-30/gluconolactonase/LRE family protein n=1 Tax=Paraglaciecola sp. TaxID=1920173 RepID=UPI003EFA3F38